MIICCAGKEPCREEMFVAQEINSLSSSLSEELYYRWNLSDGKIVDGQGRIWIQVDARKVKKWPIDILVQIEGFKRWPKGCPLEAIAKVQKCKNAKVLIQTGPPSEWRSRVHEKLTGNLIELGDAVRLADVIILGSLVELGTFQPAAPGQVIYQNRKVEFVRVLKEGRIKSSNQSLWFTVQLFPPESPEAEVAPEPGEEYLFFLEKMSKRMTNGRVMKILRATDANVKRVNNLIEARSVKAK